MHDQPNRQNLVIPRTSDIVDYFNFNSVNDCNKS